MALASSVSYYQILIAYMALSFASSRLRFGRSWGSRPWWAGSSQSELSSLLCEEHQGESHADFDKELGWYVYP